jgi:uncharacterized protein (TIGR02118 family)
MKRGASPNEEGEMIKVSVFYPSAKGKRFDMEYYCAKHMPLVQQKLGAACKSIAVEQGLSGIAPGSEPTYIAVGHMYFDSVEEFQAAFGPHAEALMRDIPNYTNIEPVIEISEVKI